LASSLATGGIENGASRSFAISLAGHLALGALLFFLPTPRSRVFVEEIPRSVKLIATLDLPSPAPVKPVRKEKPKAEVPEPPPPAPKPARAPRPAPSAIKVPTKKATPLFKPRSTPAPPSSLKDKLSSRLSGIDSTPVEQPKTSVPDLTVPKMASLPVPAPTPLPARVEKDRDLVPLSDFPYSWYIAVVKDTVYSRWKPPSRFVLGGRKIASEVSFRIMRDGSVRQVGLKESSGHRLFDQSTLAALTTLSVLAALPADYKEDYLDVVIRFQNPNR
jgi:TonB family protein